MAMLINDDTLTITLPNSEATINAQHKGISDRTVGSYYLSEIGLEVQKFLNELNGEFYIDLLRTVSNLESMINLLTYNKLEKSFKRNLVPQTVGIKVIKNYIASNDSYYKIETPILLDKGKYLKIQSFDNIVSEFKDLCLGELTTIVFKKLSDNTFIIYGDVCKDFHDKLKNNRILKWR